MATRAERTTRTSAGRRRTPVTLWATTSARDPLLGQPAGFQQFGRDFVEIETVPFIVNAAEHGFLYRVKMNYRSDVVTAFRTFHKRVQIRARTLTLNVVEINDVEQRSIELVLHCAEA